MIRTYPICQSPAHRHQESLRSILRRLERDLEREPVLSVAGPAPRPVAGPELATRHPMRPAMRPAIFGSRPALPLPLARPLTRGLAF